MLSLAVVSQAGVSGSRWALSPFCLAPRDRQAQLLVSRPSQSSEAALDCAVWLSGTVWMEADTLELSSAKNTLLAAPPFTCVP